MFCFRECQILSITLNSIEFSNVCLHGFLKQRERVAALNKFKSNHCRILIATDVASRGLDIPAVDLVMNHRLPRETTDYIHRVGRTARAGKNGMAISVFRFPKDIEFLEEIEKAINTKLTEHTVDQRSVERIFMQVSVSKREAELSIDNKDFDEKIENYRRKKWIEEGKDPDEMEAIWKREQKAKHRKYKKEMQLKHKKFVAKKELEKMEVKEKI